MDVDPRGLPLPGKLVDGVREVVHEDIECVPKARLQELCDGFGLGKTGNMATLKDRLRKFSADRREWDGLPGARNSHRGPRDGGVTKGRKKKGTTKRSTQRRQLLFSASASGTGSTARPCLPTEGSRDMRTDEEKAELLAWGRRCAALNAVELEKRRALARAEHEPSPPRVSLDATARVQGEASNAPASPEAPSPPVAAQVVSECPTLAERLQQVQAELAALTMAIAAAGGSAAAGVAPCPAAAVATDGPASPAAAAAATDGHPPTDYIRLGNGTLLPFTKQDIPDPPLISFAKDIPRLMRVWDDSTPEWSPSEAVLYVQGEPIALKHWPSLYRYGKSRQWAGTKKNWAHWRDIAASWQTLTEDHFWLKFSTGQQRMSYTAICEVLKEERMAADRHLAERARDEYGDGFGSVFEYRRGGQHLVKNKQSAIARHYRSLHTGTAAGAGAGAGARRT